MPLGCMREHRLESVVASNVATVAALHQLMDDGGSLHAKSVGARKPIQLPEKCRLIV